MIEQERAEPRVEDASTPEPEDDTSTDEDEVDEQSEESFPASDPPAY